MPRAEISRRSLLRGACATGAAFGLDALFTADRTDAAAVGPNDKIKVTKVEVVRSQEFVGLRQNLDRRRHCRLGRDAQGRRQGVRRGRARSRALPGRPGSESRRVPLAGDSSRRVLSRRTDQDRHSERDRSGALGHQGQSLRRACLQAARRPDARPHPRLRPGKLDDRRQRDEGRVRMPRALRSNTSRGRNSWTKWRSVSKRCAIARARASISASTFMAR